MSQVQYTGYNTGRGPSPVIWADCPWMEIINDPGIGLAFFDDFLNGPVMATAASQGGYYSYQDAGVTIKPLATEVGGVMQVAGNDADEDEGHLTTGGNSAGMVKIADSGGKKLWFEGRIRVASVADSNLAFFLGLAEEGLAAADALVDATGVLKTTADWLGFRTLAANGDSLDIVYQKASQTLAYIKNDALDILAATWYKLGLKFDPKAADGKVLKAFVNGVQYGDGLTLAQVGAADFPDGEELALLLAVKTTALAEVKVDLDWWRLAQLF